MPQLTYQQALDKINNGGSRPVYIPVTSMQEFNYDVYSYYNEYYASPATTQNRRILRNYESNNQTIKKSNANPFINNKGKKFNFLYTYAQNYMIVQDLNSTDVYILINKSWCKLKHFSNYMDCDQIKEFIKSIAVRKEEN
jgi:hypothetical protein